MIARLGLRWRIGLIVLVALIGGVATLLAVGAATTGFAAVAALPTPQRLVALATLMDGAPFAERALIAEAASSRAFEVRVEPGPIATGPDSPFSRAEQALLDAYRAALGDRALAVVLQQTSRLGRRLPFVSALNEVDLRIGLRDGAALVVSLRNPVMLSRSGLPIAVSAGVAGIAIALVALVLINREFAPVASLARAVDRLDPDDEADALRSIPARAPEIRALVEAFTRLQQRVRTLNHARMALLAGVQHDVRSFATRLRLRVEHIADPDQRDRAANDIAHMIALLDDALISSRAGAGELDLEMVDLAAFVAGELEDRRAAGDAVALAAAQGAQDLTVLADVLAVRRIIENVVGNALKYGRRATVSLHAESAFVTLVVDDEGPGIPAPQRALVLEPFTRLEASRSRSTGGAGLGLAVALSLARAHGGDIRIEDAPQGGARVLVSLPRFRQRP